MLKKLESRSQINCISSISPEILHQLTDLSLHYGAYKEDLTDYNIASELLSIIQTCPMLTKCSITGHNPPPDLTKVADILVLYPNLLILDLNLRDFCSFKYKRGMDNSNKAVLLNYFDAHAVISFLNQMSGFSAVIIEIEINKSDRPITTETMIDLIVSQNPTLEQLEFNCSTVKIDGAGIKNLLTKCAKLHTLMLASVYIHPSSSNLHFKWFVDFLDKNDIKLKKLQFGPNVPISTINLVNLINALKHLTRLSCHVIDLEVAKKKITTLLQSKENIIEKNLDPFKIDF